MSKRARCKHLPTIGTWAQTVSQLLRARADAPAGRWSWVAPPGDVRLPDVCLLPTAFQRHVRVYDQNGKLSRHMNPEIDEIVLKFETSLGLPPVMSPPP